MPRALNSYEMETARLIREKINQPLFETTVRFLVTVKDKKDLKERIKGIKSTLSNFSVGKYQALIGKRNFFFVFNKIRLLNFSKRLLSLINNKSLSLLSVSEISDLYHFPYADITKTEGLVKSKSRDLPAPLSMKKSNADLDVVVGKNSYGGEETSIGISLSQRQKHMYIVGKTGMGKTEMLKNMIYQDMVSGKGMAVLDPHGDLFYDLLKVIPKSRQNDVIVFNPADKKYPVGLNILSNGITFTDIEEGHDWITSATLAVFKKITDEKYWGPRLEHILRNAVMTALLTPNPRIDSLRIT